MKSILMLSTITICLAGCASTPPVQPPNPDVTKKIVEICTHSGFFKTVNGIVSVAYPAAGLPISLLDMGIDKVCMNPEKYSSDISTVEWLLRNMPRQTAKPTSLHER